MKSIWVALTVITFSSTSTLFASHIVGGEMTYACVGNNDYIITLKVYRDCYNGVAPFDDPAFIGIYRADGSLFKTVNVTLTFSDTINNVVSLSCDDSTGSICYEQGVYVSDTINFPPIGGGYFIIYQRCCRNLILVNVFDASTAGASFFETVGSTSFTCNNSPVFNLLPPRFFCIYEPLSVNFTAYDLDGDSLAYELCSVYNYGDFVNVQPNPPLPPPYLPVPYLAPYDSAYPIAANPALAINPQTGLLTGTPTALGNYAVGIAAKEYRNGSKIGIHRMDFHVNVIESSIPSMVDQPEAASLKIYPDPASRNIEIDGIRNSEIKEVVIIDFLGRKMLLPYTIVDKRLCCSIGNLSQGPALVSVHTSKEVLSQRIIIIH